MLLQDCEVKLEFAATAIELAGNTKDAVVLMEEAFKAHRGLRKRLEATARRDAFTHWCMQVLEGERRKREREGLRSAVTTEEDELIPTIVSGERAPVAEDDTFASTMIPPANLRPNFLVDAQRQARVEGSLPAAGWLYFPIYKGSAKLMKDATADDLEKAAGVMKSGLTMVQRSQEQLLVAKELRRTGLAVAGDIPQVRLQALLDRAEQAVLGCQERLSADAARS